ncbi:MAG: alpha/beta hydrolase [Betaproteobacteria bacterium HGW-Betaproteobacteria-11]|nr:MAG: alpha/beta hydrolase [Betaproteobacteria bacterium HGW-Betaproteobacteria-11]
MNSPRFATHEILSRLPAAGTAVRRTPLLFIHGAFTGAWCWDEHFLTFFAEAGYAAHALSLSGHGASPGRERLDSLSIDDYVADVATAVAALPAPPVLIGHSMGGFVVQKYLERHTAPAAVLMCSVPPQGLLSAAIGLMFSRPGLMKDLNAMLGGGHVALDALRDALFAQPIDVADLKRFHRLAQPESHRALWDMSLFSLPRSASIKRTPLRVQGAEFDHLIPASLVEMTARTYGVEAKIFPAMGHGLMLEHDWPQPAQDILDWLRSQDL